MPKTDTKAIKRLGKEIGDTFDSFAVEVSKLAPIVAKSVAEVHESFIEAQKTLKVRNEQRRN